MAIRYVKDFEFPSAAGYTKSSPSKVTGQMYAKGGQAKAPKGIMVVIGVGAPKKGPMKKAEGSKQSEFSDDGYDRAKLQQMMGDIAATSEAERMMRKPTPTPKTKAPKVAKKGSPYIPGTNIKPEPGYMEELERRSGIPEGIGSSAAEAASPGYKKGGKIQKVMHEYKAGELHSGSKKGPMVKNPKQAIAIALSEAGKSKKAKGGYAKGGMKDSGVDDKIQDAYDEEFGMWVRDHGQSFADAKAKIAAEKMKQELMNPKVLKKAKGGKVSHMEWEHSKEDLAQDRKLAKKHGMSLEAWEKSAMDKKHDAQQSPKGLKKGGACYADGGMAAQSPLQRMSMAPRAMGMGKAKAVPVAPRAPMIAPPSMGQRGVGVNAKRPGGPDVGQLRAAMAKAASQAMPQNAPSMMKKGGKAK